jgi:hypothetical protein
MEQTLYPDLQLMMVVFMNNSIELFWIVLIVHFTLLIQTKNIDLDLRNAQSHLEYLREQTERDIVNSVSKEAITDH